MKLSRTPGLIKKFRRTPWRFQATFGTPLKNLEAFVSAILADSGEFDKGRVILDAVVFEPKNLKALLAANSLPTQYGQDWSIEVEGKQQVRGLLVAALSDWVDFVFVPTPKPFVIYADHDELTTFFANTKSNLNLVAQSLLAKGFTQIHDYQRQL